MASTAKIHLSSSSDGTDNASNRALAHAIYAVTEQHQSPRMAALLYGVQHMMLYRLVRAHEQQQQKFHQTSLRLPPQEPAMVPIEPFEPPVQLPERLQLTPEQNDEVISLLYDEYRSSLRYYPGRIVADNRSVVMEDYWFQDQDISEVVRFVVSRDARCDLPVSFPSTRWLNIFKRDNGLVDAPIPRQDDQFRYHFDCTAKLNTDGREPMPARTYYDPSRIGDYNEVDQYWSMSESESNETSPSRFESQRPAQQLGMYYSLSRISDYNEGDQYWSTLKSENNEVSQPRLESQRPAQQPKSKRATNDNDRKRKRYRQSNKVSPETWERAIEDVVTHGMSLRRTARAHGVHFAALHRRIKKRSQQKEALPYDPHYIPLESESCLVRIIHARADLGVLMSYAEVEDLFKRTALNHRSELSIHDATELMRKFRSRVEASVRHLVEDWPLPAADALYSQLEPATLSPVTTTIPTETGDIISLTFPSTSSVSANPILSRASVLHRISGNGPAIPVL